MSKDNRHVWITSLIIIVVVIATIYLSWGMTKRPQINFTAVRTADITQGLSEDGTVVSSQDLALAFENGGTVAKIDVAVGDQVKAGQALVELDRAAASAGVNQASAALSAAQASYQKLQDGQTSASLDVAQAAVTTAQTALDNAQKTQTATIAQQNLIVQNAQISLFNSNLAATPSSNNVSTVSPTITGTYTGTKQGQYNIIISTSGSGQNFSYSGLESGSAAISTSGPTPLGTLGLYIQFPSSSLPSNDTWTVAIPNTKASSYLTNLNAYNAALQTQNQAVVSAQSAVNNAQSALAQAQSNLQLAQTPARPEDIQASKAQVDAAAAALQNAQNALDKSTIYAPIDGVITDIDTKIGETLPGSALVPGTDAIKMISAQNFQIQTYVSEADIGKIQVGQNASVTLDSYGNSVVFPTTIIAIDPSATVQNGINTYKTTLQFNQSDDRIKEGMDANISLTGQTDKNALVVPTSSIITQGDQDFVLTTDNSGHTQLTAVKIGINSLDGMTEILSGLSNNQQIASFGNN